MPLHLGEEVGKWVPAAHMVLGDSGSNNLLPCPLTSFFLEVFLKRKHLPARTTLSVLLKRFIWEQSKLLFPELFFTRGGSMWRRVSQ